MTDTLFDPGPPMVRRGDPVTSHLAAKRVDIKGGQAKVLRALHDLVTGTDHDIETHAECGGMGRGSAIKRRLELQREGLIEACGYTAPPRRLTVWRLTREGRDAVVALVWSAR